MTETQKKPAYKRRNYFIDKSFQSKFILKFCIVVGMGGLLTVGALYFLAMRSTTVSIVDSRVLVRTTADFMLPVLIQTVVVVTIIVGAATGILTLLFSHRIAGPLYRFKKMVDTLKDGDFSVTSFKIRHLDQLQELAVAFDNMIAKIKEELKSIQDQAHAVKEKADSISESDVNEHKRAFLRELKKASSELNKTINYFKI